MLHVSVLRSFVDEQLVLFSVQDGVPEDVDELLERLGIVHVGVRLVPLHDQGMGESLN